MQAIYITIVKVELDILKNIEESRGWSWLHRRVARSLKIKQRKTREFAV